MKILYICSSQFSGTTLLSFLLNCHSKLATIGHTIGWKHAANEDFRCSCGQHLKNCQLFRKVAAEYARNGLAFDATNFGTDFRLTKNTYLNRLLTGGIPLIRSNSAELMRDKIVSLVPPFQKTLSVQRFANEVLMGAVLNALNAEVYVDNSHSPYRYRILAEKLQYEILPVHLVRDPRGVVLSMMTNSGFSLQGATKSWIRHQLNIIRITRNVQNPLVIHYEDLCRNPNTELYRVHDAVGVAREEYEGNFKSTEHHILGNRMRTSSSAIKLDERWRRDLPDSDRQFIERQLKKVGERDANSVLAGIVNRYQ